MSNAYHQRVLVGITHPTYISLLPFAFFPVEAKSSMLHGSPKLHLYAKII
jgi:hypothetical protein